MQRYGKARGNMCQDEKERERGRRERDGREEREGKRSETDDREKGK